LVLNDEQLREVVRLLNSNRAVKATSFDEQHVLELIRQELEVFAADRVNMSDWALSAGGARIMPSHTSQGYAVSFLDFFSGRKSAPPSTILNVRGPPSVGAPISSFLGLTVIWLKAKPGTGRLLGICRRPRECHN